VLNAALSSKGLSENMEPIDKIIGLLAENQWLETEQIRRETEIPKEKLVRILNFMKKYNFVDYEEAQNKVRITPLFRELVVSQPTPLIYSVDK